MNNIIIDSSNGFLKYKVDKTDFLLMEKIYQRRYAEDNSLNSMTVYKNESSRKAGILGELIFHSIFLDAIKSPEIDIHYDFILNKSRIDVKCKLRKDSPKFFHDASLFEYQSKFNLDEYVFMSTIPNFSFVWICGYIAKQSFMSHKNLQIWNIGDVDNSNGMKFKRKTLSLKYNYLNQFIKDGEISSAIMEANPKLLNIIQNQHTIL